MGPYSKTHELIIHRNPLKPQILNLIKSIDAAHGKSSYKAQLRGLISANKIYVWDSWEGIHDDVFERLVGEGYLNYADGLSVLYLQFDHDDNKIKSTSLYTFRPEPHNAKFLNPAPDHREILDRFIARWNA